MAGHRILARQCRECGEWYPGNSSVCPYCSGRLSRSDTFSSRTFTGVAISSSNSIPGHQITRIWKNFEFTIPKFNIAANDPLNKFLAMVTNKEERLAKEAYAAAEKEAKELARSKGCNGIINYNVYFDRVGEWASINMVNIRVSGTLCEIQ